MTPRNDGRKPAELRPVDADSNFLEQPHGVVLWSQGKTRVLCTASVKEGVPRWLHRSGRGWMTGGLGCEISVESQPAAHFIKAEWREEMEPRLETRSIIMCALAG